MPQQSNEQFDFADCLQHLFHISQSLKAIHALITSGQLHAFVCARVRVCVCVSDWIVLAVAVAGGQPAPSGLDRAVA